VHPLKRAGLKRIRESLEVLRPGVATTVDEVRLEALALSPLAHRTTCGVLQAELPRVLAFSERSRRWADATFDLKLALAHLRQA
jgi:hypothetical protein